MSKKIECEIKRDKWSDSFVRIRRIGQWITPRLCVATLRYLCPALVKGLRPGQSRKLVLTQTAKGIKLERKV